MYVNGKPEKNFAVTYLYHKTLITIKKRMVKRYAIELLIAISKVISYENC